MNGSARALRIQDNLEEIWEGSPSNFPRQWLGYDEDHLLYTFFQESPDHPNGWGGMETFVRPPAGVPVSWGYGALPGRLWYQNAIIEADGSIAAASGVLAPRIYLSNPAFRDLGSGNFVPGGSGGIHPQGMAHDAYIERTSDGDLRFVSPWQPGGITLSQIAAGAGGAPGPSSSGGSLLPVLALVGIVAVVALAAQPGKKLILQR